MKDHMNILVPVDGSHHANHAAALAGALAAATDSSIRLLFVTTLEDGKKTGEERFIPVNVLVAGMQSPDEVFAQAKEAVPQGVPVTCHTLSGMPAPHILQFAKENACDFIVIGSKGASAVEGFLLGSVSQKVMEEAECSVLLVK